MNSTPTPAIAPNPFLARLLSALSGVLLVVFLAAVLAVVLPPKLLDPHWQLQLAAALINNATLALVGALLLPMAAWVDPLNNRLRARSHAIRRWALAAAIAFLLLIPLQAYAGWTLYTTVTGRQQQQTTQASQKLADLRQAISIATTPQELQASVQKLFGQNAGLSPAELRTPMPELRSLLLARAEQASQQLMQRVDAQATMKPDRLVMETIRIAISALAYGIGFAFLAGALPRGQPKVGRKRQVDEDYFKQLAE